MSIPSKSSLLQNEVQILNLIEMPNLFSLKTKKYINLTSAEFALRDEKIKDKISEGCKLYLLIEKL